MGGGKANGEREREGREVEGRGGGRREVEVSTKVYSLSPSHIRAFTLPTLWVVFFIYFIFACWTYGAGIPSGLFIPCLVIGATYGRFVATVLRFVHMFIHVHACWQKRVLHIG